MAGMLVWVIILIGIFCSLAKGKKQSRAQQQHRTEATKRTPQPAKAQPQHKKKPAESNYKPQTPQKQQWREQPKRNTQQTASYSNNYHRSDTQKPFSPEQESLSEKNKIVAAAKENTREVERDNDLDAENEHLMDAVYDAIVKGPKNTMEFQRDFIAEGMDMLNSFDL